MSTKMDFIREFSVAMDKFGADYRLNHGTDINGSYLLSALVRWTAATIASCPERDRADILLQAVALLHKDLNQIEDNGLVSPVIMRPAKTKMN